MVLSKIVVYKTKVTIEKTDYEKLIERGGRFESPYLYTNTSETEKNFGEEKCHIQ